jgi:hypothetical protein
VQLNLDQQSAHLGTCEQKVLCFFERSDGRITRDGGKTLQKVFERFSPFQVVEQGLDRHSRSAKHRSSAKNIPIFDYDFHRMIVPRAWVQIPAAVDGIGSPFNLMSMTITDDLVETFLKCPTKCFLRSRGEVGTENAYATGVRTKNNVFRIEGTKRLVAGVPPDESAIGTQAMGSLKPAQWRLGIDFAVQSQNLPSSCHAVEQLPSAGRGRTAQFVPIPFLFINKLNRDDKLLLGFDARSASPRGRSRQDHVVKVKTSVLSGDVRNLTDKIGTLLASPSPPDLVINRHCTECEFQNRCRQKAVEKDDVSLLCGMTEKERTDFNSTGIFTVTQLSYTFRRRRRPHGLRDKKERYHHSLKALAIKEKKIHIVGSPELKIEGTPVYMDVEGLPDRDFYYLIGIRFREGDSVVQHSLWADSPTDDGNIWREFLSKPDGSREPSFDPLRQL